MIRESSAAEPIVVEDVSTDRAMVLIHGHGLGFAHVPLADVVALGVLVPSDEVLQQTPAVYLRQMHFCAVARLGRTLRGDWQGDWIAAGR